MRSFRKNEPGRHFSQVRNSHFDTPRKWQSFRGASTRAQKTPCTFPRGVQNFWSASKFRAPPLGHLGASLFAKSREKGGGPAIFWRGLLNNLSVSTGSGICAVSANRVVFFQRPIVVFLGKVGAPWCCPLVAHLLSTISVQRPNYLGVAHL